MSSIGWPTSTIYISRSAAPHFLVLVYKVSDDLHLEFLNHPLVLDSTSSTRHRPQQINSFPSSLSCPTLHPCTHYHSISCGERWRVRNGQLSLLSNFYFGYQSDGWRSLKPVFIDNNVEWCGFRAANSRSATESAESSQVQVSKCRKINKLFALSRWFPQFISMLQMGKVSHYSYTRACGSVVWCACNRSNKSHGVVEIVKVWWK